MIISTTSQIEGKHIKEYRGVVFGEVVSGIDFVRDFIAGITNFAGGRASEYEEEINRARADAIREMMEKAKKIGANSLVGVKVDIETITMSDNKGSMIIVTTVGTAVVVD